MSSGSCSYIMPVITFFLGIISSFTIFLPNKWYALKQVRAESYNEQIDKVIEKINLLSRDLNAYWLYEKNDDEKRATSFPLITHYFIEIRRHFISIHQLSVDFDEKEVTDRLMIIWDRATSGNFGSKGIEPDKERVCDITTQSNGLINSLLSQKLMITVWAVVKFK